MMVVSNGSDISNSWDHLSQACRTIPSFPLYCCGKHEELSSWFLRRFKTALFHNHFRRSPRNLRGRVSEVLESYADTFSPGIRCGLGFARSANRSDFR